MKKNLTFLLLAIAILFTSCQQTILEGTVVKIDEYGGLEPSFTAAELEAAGVTYGDLLAVTIGENLEVVTPYVDAYTETGSMSPCLCNYNRAGKKATLSMSNGSFSSHVGGNEGDRLVVKMKKKGGYLREYNLLQGTYSFDRADYSSDEVFANFRELATTGLKPGVLYRGTSPISFKNNKVRFQYVAALCQKNGIKTIVDIADSEEKVLGFISAEENAGSYMRECLRNNNIICIGSNADYLDDVYMGKLACALREMTAHPQPYLIHCNEGKDRTGFYCLLLETLCGATVDEIKADYMGTFENLYHQEKDSEQYELTWKKNGYRMLYLINNPQTWDNVTAIDWDNASIDGADLAKAAEEYIIKAGLSADEVKSLKAIISVQ